MTTKEFMDKVKEMGLEIKTHGKIIFIYNGEYTVASTTMDTMHFVDTSWNGHRESLDSLKEKLLPLLVEYTSTPLDERDGTLYYLKLKRIPLGYDWQKSYLNYDRELERFDMRNDVETDVMKCTFTMREIKLMDKMYSVLKDYKMIEVK